MITEYSQCKEPRGILVMIGLLKANDSGDNKNIKKICKPK